MSTTAGGCHEAKWYGVLDAAARKALLTRRTLHVRESGADIAPLPVRWTTQQVRPVSREMTAYAASRDSDSSGTVVDAREAAAVPRSIACNSRRDEHGQRSAYQHREEANSSSHSMFQTLLQDEHFGQAPRTRARIAFLTSEWSLIPHFPTASRPRDRQAPAPTACAALVVSGAVASLLFLAMFLRRISGLVTASGTTMLVMAPSRAVGRAHAPVRA